MIHQKKTKKNSCFVEALIIIVLSLLIIQTIQVTQAQDATSNGSWALSFQIQNGQNVTTNTFTPFDQIQLNAYATYHNASQPDLLVTFKIQGPSGTTNPINITQVAVTNSQGIAESSFVLPVQAPDQDSLIGTWQASATIRTTNGTIQQTLGFTTRWNIEIISINTHNKQGQNQTIFYPGNTIATKLLISNQGLGQMANITINIQDLTGKIINQTQIQNKQIDTTSTNPTQVQANIQVPNSAAIGEATITASIYSGNFQNVDIPAAQNKTTYFSIATNTAPTTTSSPTPPPFIENTVSLFSWTLVATGFFTFTLLFIFLKRKPTSKIGTQTPKIPSPTPSQTTASPAQPTSQATLTAKIAPEKIINATIGTQPPSIYENLEIPTPQTTSPQEQKQLIVNYLTKISSANERIQALEAELKIEKEQLNKEITGLTKTLDEQERTVKNYFDSIRQEIEKIKINNKEASTQEKKPDQPNNNATEKKY